MNFGKESETLEFKKTTGEIKEAVISISSILNKHGLGTLYFGIKPNGDVIGQEVSESSLRDISRVIYESVKPQIYPAIEELVIEDKHVIKVEFSGDNTPYSAFGKYYLRTADEDREVTPSVLKQFFIAKEYKEQWEKGLSKSTSKQYNKNTINSFIKKAIEVGRLPKEKTTPDIILNRFGLTNGEYLTNAGEALFGNTYPVAVKAAVFATNEKLTFLDMKLYEDNILNLLQITEEYVLKNIMWRVKIIGMERTEIPEIPVAVIREVIANSFAHAQYNLNTTHEICIHPDMITFYSPGTFASTYKPEDYIKKNVQSSLRNATIAKILYLNNTIEQFGSGFKRINSLCKDAGIKFSYNISDEGFKMTIYRKKMFNTVVNNNPNVVLNKTEKSVLSLLKKNPRYTREELADATSKTIRTMQRVLNSLKDKSLIVRKGSDKDGYWFVK